MRHTGRPGKLTVGLTLALLISGGLEWVAPTAAVAAGESAFVGLTPCRLVDTRGNGFADPFGPPALATGVPRDFPLAGQCGIPLTALAVSLNVTATSTQGPGFLLLYPQGGAQPLVSTLNYVAGETVANAAIVPLGPGGLTVVAGVSGTDLVLDVNGYFTDSLVHAVSPDSLFVGPGAGNLANNTGLSNTAVGANALFSNTFGGGNTAIGLNALQNNSAGAVNTAVGSGALSGNIAGLGNIALGSSAGSIPTNGLSNIHIGNNGEAADTLTIRVGIPLFQNRTFIAGIHGITTGGAAVPVMIDSAGQLGTGPVFSTRRAKTDIEDIGDRSRRLHVLRPVTFHYRAQPDGPLEYGLIAEEVAEVYPELVVRDATGEPETVRYHLLPPLLLSELQRQERVLAEKDRELRAQAERLQAQAAQLTDLAAAVAELAAEVARLTGRASRAARAGEGE